MNCSECGSKFELTEHHDKDSHLPRKDPQKSKHRVILCETCHRLKEHKKDLKLYHIGLMKRYNKKMNKLNL